MFIELTAKEGYIFSGNVNLLERILDKGAEGSYVVGWNNNGGFAIKDKYKDVMKKLNP